MRVRAVYDIYHICISCVSYALISTPYISCMHAHSHTYTHLHTHAHTYTHKHTHTCIHNHIHTHMHIHTHIYTYTPTHIHQHTHTHTATGRAGCAAFLNRGNRRAWGPAITLHRARVLENLSAPGAEVHERSYYDLVTALGSDDLALLHSR